MRLTPDGKIPPKKKRSTTSPASRPAPALRDSPKVVKRKRANPKRKLSTRQERLERTYGDEYRKETGDELRNEAGLMRALLEANLASAAELRDVANLDADRPDRREPDPEMLADNVRPRARAAASAVRRGLEGPIGGRGTAPHVSEPGAGLRFDIGEAVDSWKSLLAPTGGGGQDSDLTPEQSRAKQDAMLAGMAPSMRADFERGGAQEDKIAEALLGGGLGGLATGALRATGLGLAARTGGGMLPRTTSLTTKAAPAARTGATGLDRVAAPIASRFNAAQSTRLGLKDVVHPWRTTGKIAAKSPAHAAAIGAAAAATSPVASEIAAKTKRLKKPPIPLDKIDNFGVAEAAWAAGGELSPQQIADIERELGKNAVLIPSTEARNRLLELARKNGWNDTDSESDLTIIQHSMIEAPGGARKLLGRAFQDIAALSDIAGSAQAIGAAVKQSADEGSPGPGLKMLEESFVDPVTEALTNPISSFKANPVLTGVIWSGAARTAGGAGARFVPKGDGVRKITLPGQGRVVVGRKPRNLVDRFPSAARDTFLSAGNPEGNPIQRLAHNRAVAFQTQAGKKFITQAQHRADVEVAARTHKAEKAVMRMHPDVAAGFNEVTMASPQLERPTWDSYLQDFDAKIAGMSEQLAMTKQRLAARIKTGERAGDLKIAPKSKQRRKLVEKAKTQAAAIERYRNLKDRWAEHKPNPKDIHEAAAQFGKVEDANIDTIMEGTGGDGGLRENLETRPYADVLALDPELRRAVEAEQKAARSAFTAAAKARVAKTGAADAELAARRAELDSARTELSRVRQLRELANTPPEKVAERAVAGAATDKTLLEAGIVADSAALRRSLDIYRTEIKRFAGRTANNQSRVNDANYRIGSEIITPDGEHGIITGTKRGTGGGMKLAQGGGIVEARGGGASSKPTKAIVFEVTVIAKDGSQYRTEIGGVEAAKGMRKFDALFGVKVERGNKERAGWQSKATPEDVQIVGENRHPLSNEPIYEFPNESGAAVVRLLKPLSGEQIGVAKITTSGGFGQRIPGQDGIATSYHVTAKHGDTTYTIPEAMFETVDEARAFARELDARMAERPEGHAVTNEANAMLAERAEGPDANEGIPDFGGESVPSRGDVDPSADAGPEVIEPDSVPSESPIPARFTPQRIKQARAGAKKLRTEADRLERTGERQKAAAAPVTLKIPVGAADAMIAKLRKPIAKPRPMRERDARAADGRAALLEALEAAKTTKTHRTLDVPPELVPALRSELRALKTTAATRMAEKLPQSVGASRSAKAAGSNLDRAATLRRRAETIERRTDELEAARKAEERAARGQQAETARTVAEERAAERVETAQQRLSAAEEAAGIARSEKMPERPDLAAIQRRQHHVAAVALRERGSTPAFRPHVRAEEGPRATFAVGGRDRSMRESFVDTLGPSRLKHNTLENIRAGAVKADVHLTIRAMKAPLQAKYLADGGRVLADKLGERIELAPGAELTSPIGRTDAHRTLGDLYSKVESGNTGAAEELFHSMFEVVDDLDGNFDRTINADEVVVKTAADTYYVMPRHAVDDLRDWFKETMEAYNKPGFMDKFTKAWRTQALNTTPTTPINNFLGNVILALVGGAGPMSFIRAASATRSGGKWAGVVPAIERGAGNAGATTGALSPGKGLFGGDGFGGGRNIGARGMRRWINGIRQANVMAEDYGRMALWIREATKDAKRQQSANPLLAKLRRVNDETMDMIRSGDIDGEKIHDTVNDFFGDLYKRGKYDRALFLAVPFHRWFRHMVRLSLLTMPMKYPKRLAFLMMLGQLGEDYRKENGLYPDWMRGAILMGTELVGPLGPDQDNVVTNTLMTGGFMPFSTVSQFLGGGVGGGANPITVSIASLLGEQHVEDFGNLSSSIYGDESARVRPLKDAQGNAITRGESEWFRAGLHEIAGMIPIVNKAFPGSGRDDSYLPGFDDELPIVGRLGGDHERTYAAPSVPGEPRRLLPRWLEPAEAPRGLEPFLMRMMGARNSPLVTGGPAFQITANKQTANARRVSSRQTSNLTRPPDPVP